MLKVTRYTKCTRLDTSIIGYADIVFETDKGEIAIEGVMHFKKNDSEWFKLPEYNEEYVHKTVTNGPKKNYRSVVHFISPERNKLILEAIAKAVRAFLNKDSFAEETFGKENLEEMNKKYKTEPLPSQSELGW